MILFKAQKNSFWAFIMLFLSLMPMAVQGGCLPGSGVCEGSVLFFKGKCPCLYSFLRGNFQVVQQIKRLKKEKQQFEEAFFNFFYYYFGGVQPGAE